MIDEYLLCFNAQKAGEAVGYAPASARQSAYKALQKPEVKKELEKRFAESRISSSEVIARLEAMALGEMPTKIVQGSHERVEYDQIAAAEKLGKIYALFQDKIDLNISHLNITDE